MDKFNFKKYNWVLAIPAFFILTFIYFSPEFIDGKSLNQSDLIHFEGMSHASQAEAKRTGEPPLWNTAMFSGMPELLFSSLQGDPTHYMYLATNLGLYKTYENPMTVFALMICLWIGLMCFRVKPWVGFFISAAFAFNTFFITSLEAGHITKLNAIAYSALVLGGMRLLFDKKWWMGAALLAFGVCIEIRASHYQITYYLIFVCLMYGLSELYFYFKNGEIKVFLTRVIPIGILAASLGASTQLWRVWTTKEYSEYSIRGKKELSAQAGQENNYTEEGLDKDYAFSWSEGKMESLTLISPNFLGGSSQETLEKDGPFLTMISKNYGQQAVQQLSQIKLPLYFGEQPFTGGPIYQGAILSFLFILGLFVLDKRDRIWLISSLLMALFFAWGKHLQWFNYTLFDILPGMNKFRTPAMALGIGCVVMALGAALGFNKIINDGWDEKTQKAAYKAAGATGGLLIIMWVAAGFMDVSGARDAAIFSQMFQTQDANLIRNLTSAMEAERISMIRGDVVRSFILIALACGVFYLYSKNKLKLWLAVGLVGVLTIGDVWSVAKRYINKESFKVDTNKQTHKATPADTYILADKDPNFRVLNLTENTFNEAKTSYFHKSIGGYFPAKLRRYQDLIERELSREIQVFANAVQKGDTLQVREIPALNMLNMKYTILGPQKEAVLQNPNALGNAWFVEHIEKVNTPDEEMEALASIDPSKQAIVNVARFKQEIKTSKSEGDKVELTEYGHRRLKYKSNSKNGGFAVFSEVYYPAGWVAKIDGKETDIICANYVLRGIQLPAGEHEITFDFDPVSFVVGGTISKIAGYLCWILLGFAIFMSVRAKKE
ncbi:YfhO family protein [Flammeovirga sp. MY04]|uniref:YfhO family protein n=1 Tax=Flammeovirga sp. MY04 TaxID=1191459 RepID=UPI0008062A13|nr:YfhO family protein [Flammeovirga sp. MY04]ANQ48286.1 YfhO family protein [Flammeovirga sp. MY04]